MSVDASTGALDGVTARTEGLNLEQAFEANYARLTRIVGRIIHDPARAEEIAVDVLLEWTRHPEAHGEGATGWLFRTATRRALDELRRQVRRERLVQFLPWRSAVPTPEHVHAMREDQRRVRAVLASLRRRQAELLVLRHEGSTYDELAASLGLNRASIGTLLARAEIAFRKAYVKRYGDTQ